MPAQLDEVIDWIVRAEGARGVAECLTDRDARRIMLGIADEYDKLVQREIGRCAPVRVKVVDHSQSGTPALDSSPRFGQQPVAW